jgi:amino acid adenylation domain-containing protein
MTGYRLSRQQKRIWLAQQQAGAPSTLECRLRVPGSIDEADLRNATTDLVSRHEIFRTRFEQVAGLRYPLQVVASAGQDGCLRTGLIDLASGEKDLIVAAPALCADRPTLAAAAHAIAGASPHAAEPVQYLDYSEWQQAYANESAIDSARQHWLERRGTPAYSVSLGFEHAKGEPVAGGTVAVEVDVGRLLATGVILERALLACWQLLLSRLTGQSELVVGTLSDARRSDPALSAAMGPYESWLPITIDIKPETPWREFIKRAAADCDALVSLQDAFDWEQHTEPPHVFPFSFSFDHGDLAACRWSPRAELCKLLLACTRTRGLIVAEFHCSSSFARPDIERLARYYRTLIENLPADDIAIERLRIIDEAERRVAVANAGLPPPTSSDRFIPSAFERVAADAPERPAVVCGQASISYGELNRRANQLARYLRRRGLPTGASCLLGLDRSVEFVLGTLGILKAGAGFVPVDPALPPSQVERIYAASTSIIAVTVERHRSVFSCLDVVCLDSDWLRIAEENGTDLVESAGPNDLAYIVFTSGSTGEPKGVAIEHRSLSHYVAASVERLALEPGWSYAAASTFSADLAYTALFPCLATGGTLHIVPTRVATDAEAFAACMDRNRIDVLKIVPSHFAALLTAAAPHCAFPRKRLVLGGERIPWQWMERILEIGPPCEIYNHYGPTEATVGAAVFRVGENPRDPRWASVPIGRPLAGVRIYVLDDSMQPAAEWAPGEIFIGGNGVAREYVGQTELTSERFVPDPLDTEQRLFRTGDIARRLPGGLIEFIGRADDQVKIRGYRVEPAEIAAVLARMPSVAQAVVSVLRSEAGARLVAYVVSEPGAQPPSARQLQDAVREMLPDFMVPSAVIFLDALPLTANGKLDRSRLPAPEQRRPAARALPKTEIECRIARIWTEVLGTASPGIHDNFFEIGGDSLSAIRIISRLQQAFDAEFPLDALFERPTIADLAARITSVRVAGASLSGPGAHV